jgi:NTE family protein
VIGLALGGGSARGLAHIGIIRWFEEHRIPVDVIAGTSMGGLVGGAFATGLDAVELDAVLSALNWDELFNSSNFAAKNIRRKADARAYPSRIEFGLKGGITPPSSLNNGEQVELFLSRLTAPYNALDRFDDLPTPFRAVGLDLVSASQVVLDRGSLARAMRATMSLPLIFPPVEIDGWILVDGGATNNVPADVVRAMGANHVVAVNVGELGQAEEINISLLGLAGATVDAMMRATTRAGISAADVRIDVPLDAYGSLDWRRSSDLIKEGYQAAEAARDQLLPLAVSQAEYAEWKADRQSRRRRQVPVPAFVNVEGIADRDEERLRTLLMRHVGIALDVDRLEDDLELLMGLDRYETITWRVVRNEGGDEGLLITGRAKPYAPPFMMLGINLENTTSNDFRITATARYLAYGVITSGSELRIDGTLGSNPAAGIELYEGIRKTPYFIAPFAGITNSTFNRIDDDQVIARYGQTRSRVGLAAGMNLSRTSDLRVGAFIGHIDAEVEVGDPGFPALSGRETGLRAAWRHDGQDSPVVPSSGTLANVDFLSFFDQPEVIFGGDAIVLDLPITQLSGTVNRFWTARTHQRFFAYGGLGTTFQGTPLPPDQFGLGAPFRLGAFRPGELFGHHYYVATGGYLHQVGRLPDFLGGPAYVGGWLENGDAFDEWRKASFRTNIGGGLIMDTIIGPVMVGVSAGFDGSWRSFLGVGRIFR